MREWLTAQIERDSDPATPPWLTVRMWLTVMALIISAVAICLNV